MTFPIRAARRRNQSPQLIFSDTFTTNRAAGAVLTTDAEPGPGTRTGNDPDSILQIASGDLLCSDVSASAQDYRPGCSWGALSSVMPKVLFAQVQVVTPVPSNIYIGWYRAEQPAYQDYVFGFLGSSGEWYSQDYNGSSVVTTQLASAWGWNNTYNVAVIAKSGGGEIWCKGGGLAVWTKLHTSTNARGATIIPSIGWNANGVTRVSETLVHYVKCYTYVTGMETTFDDYFD